MFKKILRKIRPNPFDKILISALKKKKKRFLLGWNRGIGDIPLGLFALVQRIRWFIPDSKITFMIRPSLKEGFLLFHHVDTIIAPLWQRDKPCSVIDTLKELNISKEEFDVIIEKPEPAYWVKHQIGRMVPYLTWDKEFDKYEEEYLFSDKYKYIAVQTHSDTFHSPWRDFPENKWQELFNEIDKHKETKVILFGKEKKAVFSNPCIVDLREKTSLLDVLSIIKNRCKSAILPDGGILSLIYYLNENFPITIVSLWSDNQGVLKQNVESPNKLLNHHPIVRTKDDFSSITSDEILSLIDIDQKN